MTMTWYPLRLLGLLVMLLFVQPMELGASSMAHHANSGSYFELIDLGGTRKDEIPWSDAAQKAATKRHKGRSGRLSIVDTREKHEFIKNNFDLEKPTWIGLRYFCGYRKLLWIDGSVHRRGGLQPWTVPWHRTHIRCGANKIPYMPVYYTKEARWQAAGSAKHFRAMLVEYPAGTQRRSDKGVNDKR